ncbi:MAG: 2-amino-4-hydroxy-6-hydroxymethyldihydropteridine diphosphokinase [Flavobacteriales bacterium]|nr:2-amino-4-hydroxy-6-hydroxymethyldihydropteridine diphosphokinase [Flavobacteriales bacterium]
MIQSTLLIGGNLGQRHLFLKHARAMINETMGKIELVSSVYESPPWGFDTTHSFLNQIVVIETDLDAFDLLSRCKTIEKALGRKRKETPGYTSRTMDVDIIYYGNQQIDSDLLKIPHPLLHERKFVLMPLAEVMPNFAHPLLHKTNLELLQALEDTTYLKKWDSPTAT